mgnify:CR=1 FL=1
MKSIKNVLLCGLGGLGCICAAAISDSKVGNLKVLTDVERLKRYSSTPTVFNGKSYNFDYILPDSADFKADLVIIATKNNGFEQVLSEVKNFVSENTIFVSLLNGIHSERRIGELFSDKNVVTCFYIGHSCIRDGRNISQDGVYEYVIGTTQDYQKEALNLLVDYFQKTNIHYSISDKIIDEYWKKFLINVGINQVSAVTGLTLKEVKKDAQKAEFLKTVMKEGENVAEKVGIENYKLVYDSAVHFLFDEIEDATPSMLQDIKAKRPTEVDIFAGEIIKLAKKYNVEVPANEYIYKKIKEKEKTFFAEAM